jgi:hypothetical protein
MLEVNRVEVLKRRGWESPFLYVALVIAQSQFMTLRARLVLSNLLATATDLIAIVFQSRQSPSLKGDQSRIRYLNALARSNRKHPDRKAVASTSKTVPEITAMDIRKSLTLRVRRVSAYINLGC